MLVVVGVLVVLADVFTVEHQTRVTQYTRQLQQSHFMASSHVTRKKQHIQDGSNPMPTIYFSIYIHKGLKETVSSM